ncbi:MAG: helix-turn-helix transcriptional regulator [Maricaulaceae bacterium]|nr:helix-turn-helix transcriptional regulator [Maricaulaceae bacterium]
MVSVEPCQRTSGASSPGPCALRCESFIPRKQACPASPCAFYRKRKALGLTQAEAAAMIGTNQWSYRDWERGYYTPSSARKSMVERFMADT